METPDFEKVISDLEEHVTKSLNMVTMLKIFTECIKTGDKIIDSELKLNHPKRLMKIASELKSTANVFEEMSTEIDKRLPFMIEQKY